MRYTLHRALIFVAAFNLISGVSLARPRAAQSNPREVVSSSHPRPLNSVIRGLEARCQCVITYEDPKWELSQIVDAPVPHPPDSHPHIPRGGPLAIGIDGLPSNAPERVRPYLEAAVSAADQKGYGAFQVVTSDTGVFHVAPSTGSFLAVPVTFASETKPMGEFVTSILSDVQAANGEQMLVVTGAIDLLKTRITAAADHEPADVVLTRVLSASGLRLSWALFYDVDLRAHYLDVHLVE